jgi:hypothetical protein
MKTRLTPRVCNHSVFVGALKKNGADIDVCPASIKVLELTNYFFFAAFFTAFLVAFFTAFFAAFFFVAIVCDSPVSLL